ncbi:hypothetical protein B0H11DRAFT_2387032 [Mycena galericulata]|nr:hypothetical protein B0H11DRAFT_2387032 [Mycena galericulata]
MEMPRLTTRKKNKETRPGVKAGVEKKTRPTAAEKEEKLAAEKAAVAKEKAAAKKALNQVAALEDKQRQDDIAYAKTANHPTDRSAPDTPAATAGVATEGRSEARGGDPGSGDDSEPYQPGDDESGEDSEPEGESSDDESDEDEDTGSRKKQKKKKRATRADIVSHRKTQDSTGTPAVTEDKNKKRKAADKPAKSAANKKAKPTPKKKGGLNNAKPKLDPAPPADNDSMVALGGPALDNDGGEGIERPKTGKKAKGWWFPTAADDVVSTTAPIADDTVPNTDLDAADVVPDAAPDAAVAWDFKTRAGIAAFVKWAMQAHTDSGTNAFHWKTWGDGKDKQGFFQSHLIVYTFAYHLSCLATIPGSYERLTARPIGALLLSAQAVERMLQFWRTGEYVNPGSSSSYFSGDVWGDTTVIGKKGKRIRVRRATKFMATIEKWDEDRWTELIAAAEEWMELPSRKRSATTSRSASEADDDVMSDDDVVMVILLNLLAKDAPSWAKKDVKDVKDKGVVLLMWTLGDVWELDGTGNEEGSSPLHKGFSVKRRFPLMSSPSISHLYRLCFTVSVVQFLLASYLSPFFRTTRQPYSCEDDALAKEKTLPSPEIRAALPFAGLIGLGLVLLYVTS